MDVDQLASFIRGLQGVKAKDLKSRTSFWRADGTRFCKIEMQPLPVIVFTDLSHANDGQLLPYSEPDHKGRLKLRLTNSQRVETARALAVKRYK